MKKITAKRKRNAPALHAVAAAEVTTKPNLGTRTEQDAEDQKFQPMSAVISGEPLATLGLEKNKLAAEVETLKKNIAERFHELATLTLMLEAASKIEQQKDVQIESLKELLSKKPDAENMLVQEQQANLALSEELAVLRQTIECQNQDFEIELAEKDKKLKSAAARLAELSLLNLPVSEKRKTFFSKRKNVAQGIESEAARTAKLAKLLRYSGLFDVEWYLQRYPDVHAAKVDPVAHYLQYGAGENRDPGPLFSTAAYARENPDVVEAKMNCLVHYLYHGRKEGRQVGIPS